MVRQLWGSATSEEESRASLQTRLTVLSKVSFWAFAALIAFQIPLYAAFKEIEPELQTYVYIVATGALAVLGFTWRGVLARVPKLSARALLGIDAFYMVFAGATFGLVACLTYDRQASVYTCLIYACFTVFTRALMVPSTAKRTLVLSSLSFVPIVFAAGWLGAFRHDKLDIPGPAFFAGDLLFNACAVLLATFGSQVIYGLRRQAQAALQLGRYTTEQKIGEGGMGTVYLAKHELLRRPTAVKLLHPDKVGSPETLDRFEREVQLMSQLTHPNTVAVYDYGRNLDGVFYYAMEYLDGINLENLVRRFGPQPGGRVVHLLVQVCGALQEAHERGFIHRDIKPANIIACQRGGMPDVAKVVDFGLVKEFTADTGASTQVVLGTPHYIAPEAFTDANSPGPAFDIYALGCVGYYLLTGRRLFEGKTAIDICIQHVTKAPEPMQNVPDALASVIAKCLAKAPGDRYSSATALAEALRALPPAKDWSDSDARAWWHDFVAREHAAPAHDVETRTITIDLGHRA